MQVIILIVIVFIIVAILQGMQTSDNVILSFIAAAIALATAGSGAVAAGASISAIATPVVGIPAGLFVGVMILKMFFGR